MIALSWELAGFLLVYQILQAIVAVAFLATLLWLEKRAHARRIQVAGDVT